MKDEDIIKLSEHIFEKCPTEARNFFHQILTKLDEIEKKLDDLVTNSSGSLIVFLPPSTFPNLKAKNALKKIAMLDLSAWGWFRFKEKKNFLQNIKKISTTLRNIPKLEQGIFFSKRLYFSVGGIGDFGSDPFREISKRFYTRIDPQNPLPALIIRTTNLEIF